MKRLLILILLLLFIPGVNAITSSGTISSSEKEIIYPLNDQFCKETSGEGFYTIGGVYLRDSSASSTDISEEDYIESTEVYESSDLAKTACDNFSLDNKDEGYLCKDTPSRTAYSCSGTIVGLSSSQEYLEKYITGGQMFETENGCLENCSGTCALKTGYSYRYAKPVTEVSTNGSIDLVTGRIYQTNNGDYAFCIQPAKSFQCPSYYTSSKELIPQYCLNSEFDLSSCKDKYLDDYRCGLAYIALIGTDNRTQLTADEYGVIDMAMRMWATKMGHLSGMNSTKYPLNNGKKTTTVNFYGITATRVEEDANYLNYGFECTTTSKNHGVICDYQNYDLYKEALVLYNDALHTNALDAGGNKIPKLVTTTLGSSGNTVQITNPTTEECAIGDANCRVIITLYDANGNEVSSDSSYCDKNYCYSKYTTENLCSTENTTIATIEIQIVDFDASGRVKEYHHCSNPSNRQIMYVLEAEGTVTTNKDYIKQYSAKVSCTCSGEDGKLNSTTDSKKYCNNYNKLNTQSSDYNGVEDGYIKDPSMSQILNSCTGEKYFREKSYETDSDTCKIYCRNEIKFYMANKEKVYTGMQFRYELEEKITNNLGSDQHLTAIVLQQRQCVSEIYYDSWLKRYNEAEKAVADAWNAWKKLDTMRYLQKESDYYPKENANMKGCTLNCDGFGLNDNTIKNYATLPNSTGQSTCTQYNASAGSIDESGSKIAYQRCDDLNGITRNDNGTITLDPDALIQNTTDGVCATRCVSIFTWYGRGFFYFNYGDGSSKFTVSDTVTDGNAATSTLACSAYAYYNITGEQKEDGKYTYCNLNKTQKKSYESRGYSCYFKSNGKYCCKSPATWEDYEQDQEFRVDETLSISDDLASKLKDIFEEMDRKYHSKYDYSSIFRNIKGYPIYGIDNFAGGACVSGVDGDIDKIINEAEEARKVYNAAQAKVRDLLTAIQTCNMYGSGLSGEPDIKYYTLTKSPYVGGNSDGSGAAADTDKGVSNHVSAGDCDATKGDCGTSLIIDEDTYSVKNVSVDTAESYDNVQYKLATLESDTSSEYDVEQIVSTANSKSIKKKILKAASCVEDTCADLSVQYDDTVYGSLTQYEKNTGIVKTDDLFNVYCEGSSCYRSVHTDEELDEESGEAWLNEPYTQSLNRIVCNTLEDDPAQHKCEFVKTDIPSNDYVSFKVTTEVDFYRPKSYYTKAFTGEVVESKSTLAVSSKLYSALGKNVYPITNESNSGLHSINYTFSNLGISKFGQSNGVNLDTYEYQCSYEVYNNTTGYDCISKYDENGVLIPSDCSNFCFYVDDTVPDLECIQWNNMGESKGYGFVFRNVDLSNLFPSGREFGTNWSNATEIIAEIQNTADEVFIKDEHLVLSVTLNSDAIKKIREYNRYRNTNAGGYLDNSLIKCDLETSLDGVNNRFANCRSTFIDEIQSGSGVLGIQANKIVRSGSVIK